MIKAKNTLEGKLNVSIVKEYPELEDITITPSLEEQKLKSQMYGYGEVTVEGIPATDIEIIPTTEEQVRTGIFKSVTVKEIESETINITPTEQEQSKIGMFNQVNVSAIQTEEVTPVVDFKTAEKLEITPTEGKYIKKVTLNKDAELLPENIKTGISIFGVDGGLADTSDADATSDDIALGKTAYVKNTKMTGTMPVNTNNATVDCSKIAEQSIAIGSMIKAIIIKLPEIDLTYYHNKSIASAFSDFINLEIIESIKVSSPTSISNLFKGDKNLLEAPPFDTSNVTTANSTFYGCISLKLIPLYDFGKVSDMTRLFYGGDYDQLTDIGGFKDLGKAFTYQTSNYYELILDKCKNLTHESLMNVINNLYDLNLTYNVAGGGTLYTQRLILGSTNLAKLTADEIAIATNKGWTVS